MRRHAKASTAGSTQRQATGLARFVRGALATRGASLDSKGSGAPSYRLVVALIAALGALAILAPSASAKYVELGAFADTGSGPGGSGSEDGQLSNPGQADVNSATGDLYIADTGNGRVQRFTETPTGATYASQIAITAPEGLAIDQSDGSVYVSNATGISKFNADLTPAGSWSDPGVTGALAVDPTSGDLLVADTNNNLIRRFESDGTAAGSFSAERPIDLEVTAAGKLLVITSTGDLVHSCANTSAVEKFSAAGTDEGSFNPSLESPGAIAIDPDNHSVLIATLVNEYWCGKGDSNPRLAELDAQGNLISTFQANVGLSYAMVPGLASAGDGSPRAYMITKSPENDGFGPTKAIALEQLPGPEVTIDPVDGGSVGGTEATLEGAVDPNGLETSWHFEYRLVGSTPWSSTPSQSAGSGEDPVDVEAQASSLQPNREYETRLVASSANGFGTSAPPNPKFSTEPTAPSVTTLRPQALRPTEATLDGFVNPNNSPSEYWFEWGTSNCSIGPCTSAPLTQDADAGTSFGSKFVFKPISGLSPQTTYHYRVLARNASGVVAGDDFSFTTTALCPNSGNLGGGALPDCRAYEMVSPPDKNGGGVVAYSTRSRVASSGDAIGFSSLAGFADAPGFNVSVEYIANRTGQPGTNGWSTHAITPPQVPIYVGLFGLGIEPKYQGEFSSDLSRGVFLSYSSVANPDGLHPMVDQTTNLYVRTDLQTPGAGSYRLVSDCPACTSPILFDDQNWPVVVGSNAGDAAHEAFTNVLFGEHRLLTADAEPSEDEFKLFEYTARPTDEIQTVSVDATAGQFKLEFDGQSTGDIAFDATAATVQSALDSLSSIAPGSVSVTGGPGDAGASSPYVISFDSGTDIAGTDVPQIVATLGTTPLSGSGAAAGVETRLPGGQHTRLASRIPGGSASECDDRGAPACVGGLLNNNGTSIQGFRPISDDGRRVIFQGAPVTTVYLREDGLRTIKVNASEKTAPDAPMTAQFETASTDGARIFFTTQEALVDTDTNGSLDVYMYDASKPASAPDNLTLVSAGSGGSGGVPAAAPVIGASDDGHYAYIMSSQQLVAGESSTGEIKMYLWHDGALSYIGAIRSSDNSFMGPMGNTRVTPDGRHLVFITHVNSGLTGLGGFQGFDDLCGIPDSNPLAGHCQQVYVYSADSGKLRCASCNPGGKALLPTGGASYNSQSLGSVANPGLHLTHPLSDDGRYVFFETTERLVPEDTNGKLDVYEYDTQSEEQHLISSGESKADSYLLEASGDGRNVFFDTAEPLSKWDTDTAYDVYDARVGGGLPEPAPVPASCQGDACQPTPPALNDQTPSSSSFRGPGNEKSGKANARACPKGKHRVKSRGKSRCIKAHKKHKRATNSNRRAGR